MEETPVWGGRNGVSQCHLCNHLSDISLTVTDEPGRGRVITRQGSSHSDPARLLPFQSVGWTWCQSFRDGSCCLSLMHYEYANNWSSPTAPATLLHYWLEKHQRATKFCCCLPHPEHPHQMNTGIFGLACLTVSRCHISTHCNLHILWKSLTFNSCPKFKHRLRVANIVDVLLRVLCVRLFCFNGHSHLLQEEKAK